MASPPAEGREEAMRKRQEREKDEAGGTASQQRMRAAPVFTMDDLDVLDCARLHHGRPRRARLRRLLPPPAPSHFPVYNRCHRLEDVVESLKSACPNGCPARIKYYQKEDHEKDCPHAPCFCPIADCGFSGPTAMLVEHFSAKHNLRSLEVPYGEWFGIYMHVNADPPTAATALVGQDGHLFLVCMKLEPSGGVIKVCCVQPHIPGTKFKCGLALSCTKTGYSQATEFQLKNTNLYDGLPDDGFPFLVPKILLPAAGISATIVVRMELTPQ
ncbi:E3 ubiquitin-protein ligase SINA-like 10 [Hordeum vulgare]|nr:E3 ubiquitin-protein ligase SINA-like 10 [Hordeum vulgare]